MTRSATGSILIWNDEGSGWKPRGRVPSDAWLASRRNAPGPYDDLLRLHAARTGVDFALAKSVMLVESGFNPRARSPKGARGLMQLMPATASRYRVRDVYDPEENVRGGVEHLADLIATFQGDIRLVLAAYNSGSGAVLRYAGVPPYGETTEYVRRAMAAYQGKERVPTLGGGFGTAELRLPQNLSFRRVPLDPPPVPVKMERGAGGAVLTNDGTPSRPAPVLGRIEP